MRRSRRFHECEEETGIDITPMLDIVFIMLIFFIVTTSFVKVAGVEVNRPRAATAEPNPHVNILVAIRANGAVWIDGREVDLGAVRANIERLHAQSPKGAVVIDADTQAETGRLVQVLDQIRAAGVEKISIAAQPGRS